ncbi:MAG: NAD(P)/FAD-dependent oxidoreductase [Smithellaceae bacterium]|nr:NAD(P)/FAD-dependent oxidoreductase [Smithellaceae bacterium]
MNSNISFDVAVIGAGVVGLAIAEALCKECDGIVVLERNSSFGMETSSRNSEVIHSGIYYPTGFLKARLCTTGKALLYDWCLAKEIPHRKAGKLIVATSTDEVEELDSLLKQAQLNGVDDLVRLGSSDVRQLEPEVKAVEALYSPSTGIIDSHQLMRSLLISAESRGATIAYRSAATAICFDGARYRIEVNGGEYVVETKALINSAGLAADKIAALAGIDIQKEGYALKYCKGSYFSSSPSPRLNHLIYPVPAPNKEGLGIHATLDLAGRVRFGPDTLYTDVLDYRVDETARASFYQAISRYLPAMKIEYLTPDMSGIRPKLQGPGEPYRDFIIREEKQNGLRGMINLIGIESPGLTSCLAIGQRVLSLVRPYL